MSRRVDPSVYTKNYYLNDCSGYDEFRKSWGKSLEPRLKRIALEIPLKDGMRILDIGCGRGEMVFWSAKKDCQTTGIDYSRNAIKLAKVALSHKSNKIKDKVNFKLGDAKKLEFKTNSFDGIFLIEVLEHIYLEEQLKVFKEINRVLKRGGFVFVHTAPNKWFNNFTYRVWSYPVSTFLVFVWKSLFGKKYPNLAPPSKIRTKSHKIMHVNEPDYFSLQKLFKNSRFLGAIKSTNITVNKPVLSWKDRVFNFLVYLYPLSNHFPFNVFWGNDYYAVLRKNK